MHHTLLTIITFLSVLFAKTFTVSDPPMIYIYHFVSYDTTSIVLHGGVQDESQNKKLRFPLFKPSDFTPGGDDVIVGKPLDPKLVSAMVTSAVAKNTHVNIAGESIQNRIKTDNFIKLVKSYDYPKRTDFIFIGEINTVATQYEIDLKLIDVSTQKIVSAESFNLPFNSLANLRATINSLVAPVIQNIVVPFLGSAYVRVDSTSRNKIRWNDISIRPLKSVVGTEIKSTSDEDYVPFQTVSMPLNFETTHGEILKGFAPTDLKLVSGLDGNSMFLAGDYRFKGFLKNNEEPFETNFTVLPGDLNEIHMSLPYTPPPKDTDGDGIPDEDDACPDQPGVASEDLSKHGCPIPPPPKMLGNITISNIWNGVGVELFAISEDGDELIMSAHRKSGELYVDSSPFKSTLSSDNTQVTILDLPLGNYVRNSFAMTEERFPGKHYVNIYSDLDSLILNDAEETLSSFIADQSKTKGREVIIYFDPFTPEEDDEYRFYLGESLTPFTVASVVGELHIVGFPTAYSDSIFVEREGFMDAVVHVESGSKKGYYLANLTIPSEEESSTQVGFDKLLKFK